MVAFLLPIHDPGPWTERPPPTHGLGSKIPHAPRKSAFRPNLPGQPSSGSVPARAPSRPLSAGPPLPHASICHVHQPVRFAEQGKPVYIRGRFPGEDGPEILRQHGYPQERIDKMLADGSLYVWSE